MKYNFVIGDKVLVNQLHNKKIFNKIRIKAADEVFEIKAIKGSMITVFSDNCEFTSNVYLFKKAPDSVESYPEMLLELTNNNSNNIPIGENINIELENNLPEELQPQTCMPADIHATFNIYLLETLQRIHDKGLTLKPMNMFIKLNLYFKIERSKLIVCIYNLFFFR